MPASILTWMLFQYMWLSHCFCAGVSFLCQPFYLSSSFDPVARLSTSAFSFQVRFPSYRKASFTLLNLFPQSGWGRKSGWRSKHKSRLPPLLQMLYVDWVSVDLNLTSRVFYVHYGFLSPQNRLLVYSIWLSLSVSLAIWEYKFQVPSSPGIKLAFKWPPKLQVRSIQMNLPHITEDGSMLIINC